MSLFLFQATVAPSTSSVPTTAPATTAATATAITNTQEVAQKKPSPWGSVGFMILLFVVLYLLMIRPNQKKEKKRKEQLATLSEGDKIVTIGGIQGTVVSVKENTVVIRSKTTEMEMLKGAISQIIR